MDDIIRITAETMQGIILENIELVDITTALDENGNALMRYELFKGVSNGQTYHYMIVNTDSARTCIPASQEKLDEFFPDYTERS